MVDLPLNNYVLDEMGMVFWSSGIGDLITLDQSNSRLPKYPTHSLFNVTVGPSTIAGLGLFASKDFAFNEEVFREGPLLAFPQGNDDDDEVDQVQEVASSLPADKAAVLASLHSNGSDPAATQQSYTNLLARAIELNGICIPPLESPFIGQTVRKTLETACVVSGLEPCSSTASISSNVKLPNWGSDNSAAQQLVGVFPLLARMNHSCCRANVEVTFDHKTDVDGTQRPFCRVVAIRHIPAGDEITFHYCLERAPHNRSKLYHVWDVPHGGPCSGPTPAKERVWCPFCEPEAPDGDTQKELSSLLQASLHVADEMHLAADGHFGSNNYWEEPLIVDGRNILCSTNYERAAKALKDLERCQFLAAEESGKPNSTLLVSVFSAIRRVERGLALSALTLALQCRQRNAKADPLDRTFASTELGLSDTLNEVCLSPTAPCPVISRDDAQIELLSTKLLSLTFGCGSPQM